ncbi:PQQ-binding-like beta-propeller repeat protein [Micromonospora sp. WMMD975]|uniref:outer membrane protein assembly factor BamB family protein n=1 Tax=Micromonospora sp. WMMD975 TaxID=3016087 RepID=UPI00249A567D|nr:PQQ-binding-like beta-propeller repeat protein [Micromonospora sp. WMMD975]WFE34433.1 PQQ-binding-like beta-propeller repeat protein [Micromonospora sp. WMMD975]
MTVIDLGELRDEAPTPGPAARPPRAVGRPFRTALALLVALVTLAAGAPPARSAVGAIPGGPGSTAFLSEDRVYVVRPPHGWPDTERELVAYRVGRELWRTPLPGIGDVMSVWQAGGRVLAAVRTGDDQEWETVALDAGTGASRWRQPGIAVPAGDGLLLFPAGGSAPRAVRRLAVTDGHTTWTAPTSADVQVSYGPSGVERLLLRSTAGETVVLDAVTGARLAARNLRPGQPPAQRRMAAVAGLLVEIREAGDAVDAYELDTLRPLWTAELPLVGALERCGALLCAGRSTGGLWALDPATGAVRWTVERWTGVLRAESGHLLVGAEDAGGARLAVLAEADGRLVADLGGWGVLGQSEADDGLLLTRPLGGGRLLLAEPDLSGGPPAARDVLTGTDCTAGRTLLVCRERGGDFTLRRLP